MMTSQELDKGLLTLKLIWSAMLMSLAIYLFVGLQVADQVKTSLDEQTFGMVKMGLYLVALAILVATRFMKRIILSGKGQNQPAAQPGRPSALQTYMTATILSLAMSEGVGILGLVLYFLGKNPMDLYLLLFLSAAAMFMHRPGREELMTLSRKWEGEPTIPFP